MYRFTVQVALGNVEFRLHTGKCLCRNIRMFMENRDHVRLFHDKQFGIVPEGGGIDMLQFGSMNGGPQQLRMKHIRQTDVARIEGLAGHFQQAVRTPVGFPHDLELGHFLQGRFGRKVFFDHLALSQLGIGDLFPAIPFIRDG